MRILTFIAFIFISLISFITNPVFTKKKSKQIKIDKEKLYKHVEFLTSLQPPRNAFHLNSLNKAADYIFKEMSKYCENVHFQEFKVEGNNYKNIICEFGKGEDLIVVGAHYDVCCEQPGADDNASGIAGLLELARLISQNQKNLKNRVQLVAYSLEEPPFFGTDKMGSFFHAKKLYEDKEKVKFMISLEMIGYFSEEKGSQKFPFPFMNLIYPDRGNFIGIVGSPFDWFVTRLIKKKMIQNSDIDVRSINFPNIIPGIDFSDHRNYWKFGYRAVMITDTAFYRNPNYHQITDTIETLNFDKMAEVVKGVFGVIIDI